MTKPVILISAGDPLGIGPEVTVKALQHPSLRRVCTPIIIGEINSLRAVGWTEKLAPLIALESALPKPHRIGPSAWGGTLSFKAVQLACKLAAQRQAAVVTAPISKQSWALAGVPFTGHTEFLRKYYGPNALMMFVSGKLCCGLVSEHFAIGDLPTLLTRQKIVQAARLLHAALQQRGHKKPLIALSGLNPHNGDNGQFGREEITRILPAVRSLRQEGLSVQGPFPIDSLWTKHLHGQFDGILCMYHDQALLGLKLAAREPIVHITAGLQITRTSPTHGTAFDISGQNKADPSSMIAAILEAVH
ncbi:MAG: 4-hydroxythreonine-4-phosphate dehydrogenase PdxA [Elusimicrobiaceae bacterium]|nr:4-hydroxythreonine-4-phosphate dehydrogenase PdxA [Elusimicrobiaceae bacterium]